MEISKLHVGETLTYSQLAMRIGRKKAARAVGNALHKNPFPVIVPCHRIVAAHGLGGYGHDPEMKAMLLGVESLFRRGTHKA